MDKAASAGHSDRCRIVVDTCCVKFSGQRYLHALERLTDLSVKVGHFVLRACAVVHIKAADLIEDNTAVSAALSDRADLVER